ILAEIVAAGGDAEMNALSVGQDGVQAEAAGPRLPLSRVLVVADAGDHLPGVAPVAAAEERGRLDAAPQVLLVRSRLERPDVLQRAPVLLGKGGERFRLLEGLAQVVRAQDLHAEERIAARGVDARLPAARVDERGVDVDAGPERPAQREFAARAGRLRDEKAFLGPEGQEHAVRHGQPPETAARMVTTAPGASAVSSPWRSRMWSELTKMLRWRRTAPVSSQMLRWRDGWLRSSSSRAARTVVAESGRSAAPPQYFLRGVGRWVVAISGPFCRPSAGSSRRNHAYLLLH